MVFLLLAKMLVHFTMTTAIPNGTTLDDMNNLDDRNKSNKDLIKFMSFLKILNVTGYDNEMIYSFQLMFIYLIDLIRISFIPFGLLVLMISSIVVISIDLIGNWNQLKRNRMTNPLRI